MGCYATREPDTVAKLPGVTQVITDKARLADSLRPLGVQRLPRGIRRFDGHQRAFVKVQDGCVLNCTLLHHSQRQARTAQPARRGD